MGINLPNFSFPPPPDPAHMEAVDGEPRYTPNPQFRMWLAQMYNWTTKFGNNANGSITANSFTRGTSPNWTNIDASGIWSGGSTFANSPFSVSMAGALTASSGSIAGWTIGSTTLSKNSAILDSAGQLVLGTANDVIYLSATDATYRMWIGNASAASAAFTVTKAGVMTATGASINGLTVITGNTEVLVSGQIGRTATMYNVDKGDSGHTTETGLCIAATHYNPSQTAILGVNQTNAAGTGKGVYGKSNSTTGYGVYGEGNNGSYGVYSAGPMHASGAVTFASTLNVTGAITGNLTGNASGTAATVTGAAQTAITSVGTLTGLTLNGTVNTYNIEPDAASTRTIGATNVYQGIHALTQFGYGFLINQDTTGAYYSTNSATAHISMKQTHSLAAAKYYGGSVPTAGTAPYIYFMNAGLVVGFVDAHGVYFNSASPW